MEEKIKPTITLDFPDIGDNKIQLEKLSATYCQEADCCQDGNDYQQLTIETENGGVCGDDTYYVISTERWAINDENELLEVIKDFKKRLHAHEQDTDS